MALRPVIFALECQQ